MLDKKVIVIGSCNTDMVINADRLPLPGETILGGNFFMNPGGKGANQAVAAARLGGNVSFIAKLGKDPFGKQSIEILNKEGIDNDYVFTDPVQPSGVALITVDSKGENCIVVASGANASLDTTDISSAKNEIESGDILLMQLEIPMETVEYAAELAFRKGVKVILNPAPARTLSDQLLKKLYILVPNKSEAEILSGVKVSDWESAKDAARVIHEKGVRIVIITLGRLGSLVYENNIFHQIDAPAVTAVDTTAAGDTFCGALCVGLSEDKSVIDSVRFATRASALTVTKMGAQSSIPYRKDLEVLVDAHIKEQ